MRPSDPALEEIWAVRKQIAAEHGFDVDALYARYVALEIQHKQDDQSTAPSGGAPPVPLETE